MRGVLFAAGLAMTVSACATSYSSEGLTGGYSDKQLEPTIWRIEFAGNGDTTDETVETYWLYRAAEVTLANGFDGFKVLSNILLIGVPLRVAANGAIFIPIPMYTAPTYKPSLSGNIKLLKLPFEAVPGEVFNAADLRKQLDPCVNGPKCDKGNVCPHTHPYVYCESTEPSISRPAQ
jgi:hypothetical protein